jgi:fructokinase
MHAISVGEIRWDVTPAGEFLGGAPFNFAYHLSRLGHLVSFVSGVGNDARGRRILERLERCAITSKFIAKTEQHPTGWVDVQFDASEQPDYVIHRPVAYDFPRLDSAEIASLCSQPVDCLYFGTLQQMRPVAHTLTKTLIDAAPRARRFYDPNLRKNSYTPQLVQELLSLATIAKLSEQEAATVAEMFGEKLSTSEAFCRSFSQRFGWEAVGITRGEHGCVALVKGEYVEAAPPPVRAVDAVGAGDAFSAAFLHGIAAGWCCAKIASFANRVAALIVSRRGAVPEWRLEEVSD